MGVFGLLVRMSAAGGANPIPGLSRESFVANHLQEARAVAQDDHSEKLRASAARLPKCQQALPGLRPYKRVGHLTVRADQQRRGQHFGARYT